MIDEIINKAKTENKSVYIFAHKYPDGDAVTSSTALAEYFKSQGIDAKYVVSSQVRLFQNIVGEIPTTSDIPSGNISLIVDTSTLSYAENDLFKSSSPEDTYVIDHHKKDEDTPCIEDELNLPKENVIRDPGSSSTCEILVSEFNRENVKPEIANRLTLGLLSDTAKLKFIKPHTLDNLAKLIEMGADYKQISSISNRKSKLKDEVAIAKVLLRTKKVQIGDSFGLVLSISNDSAQNLLSRYGIRNPQKKIFKMADIEGCCLTCMVAENEKNSYAFELRNSSTYGNLNVFDLASQYKGGGHFGASGFTLTSDSLSLEDATSEVIHTAQDMYSKDSGFTDLPQKSEVNKTLANIFLKTQKLSHNITPAILKEVSGLIEDGADYDYYMYSFRTYTEFMLQNELLSKIPDFKLNDRFPSIRIKLSERDVSFLTKKYNVSDEQILGGITAFSNINIKNASIYLPDGRGTTIDRNGNIKRVTTENLERKNGR